MKLAQREEKARLGALVCYTSAPFCCPWLSQLLALPWAIAPGTSAFLLNDILTLIFPQLGALSFTDICMADGANGLANIYWVSVKKLPD